MTSWETIWVIITVATFVAGTIGDPIWLIWSALAATNARVERMNSKIGGKDG